jgi:hypothetical protein
MLYNLQVARQQKKDEQALRALQPQRTLSAPPPDGTTWSQVQSVPSAQIHQQLPAQQMPPAQQLFTTGANVASQFNNQLIAHPVASYALPQEQVITHPQFGPGYYAQSQVIQQPQVGPLLPGQVGNQLVHPQQSTGLPTQSAQSAQAQQDMLIDQLDAANVTIVTTASSVSSSVNRSYDFESMMPLGTESTDHLPPP